MKLKKVVEITRYYSDGKKEDLIDEVLIEYDFSIYLNEHLLVELLTIPRKLKELVIGYLYTEKLISNLSDIENIEINEDERYARVSLIKSPNDSIKGSRITTDSGDYRMIPYQFYNRDKVKPLKKIPYEADYVIKNFAKLMDGSELFKNTGNVHSVLLCRGKEILYFAEDIGRYNAFDKAVGSAMLDNIDLSECSLYTSGRIPSTIAMKALRAGIPMIVSRSAPSDRTLDVAKQFNLRIIGFTKKDRFNIYNEQN